MPSKAGRRRGEAGATVVAAPVSTVPPPSFDPALLARPLRRGYEVERFNQLARRQPELTPAESDELYAYRLRRLTARERGLQRAVISGSEEELRTAIGEQERRLAELRSLEELRRRADLPAGYEAIGSSRPGHGSDWRSWPGCAREVWWLARVNRRRWTSGRSGWPSRSSDREPRTPALPAGSGLAPGRGSVGARGRGGGRRGQTPHGPRRRRDPER
jgi:hypothetical protein